MGLYAEKEKWLQQFPEVKFSEFYRDIFPEGSFEAEAGKMDDYERTGKGNEKRKKTGEPLDKQG